MDLTALSETELDALDMESTEVADWLHMIADQSEHRDLSDEESRVFITLLARHNRDWRAKHGH